LDWTLTNATIALALVVQALRHFSASKGKGFEFDGLPSRIKRYKSSIDGRKPLITKKLAHRRR
jgi:hypothetical protein